MTLKIKTQKTKTDSKTKQGSTKKLRVKSSAAPTPAPAGWDKVDTSTEQMPTIEVTKTEVTKTAVTKTAVTKTEVTVNGEKEIGCTLPFKHESATYLEVVIGGNQAWLAKASVSEFKIEGDTVTLAMPRAYARRRGLLPEVTKLAA